MKILIVLILGLFIKDDFSVFAGSKLSFESKKSEKKVTLQPMTAEGFKVFKELWLERSTQNRMLNDLDDRDTTYKRAVHETGRILPYGIETPNNFLFDVVAEDTGKKIGTIWLMKQIEGPIPSLFLFDVYIFEEFQNQGYGTNLLKVYEQKARDMGAKKLRLHVFAKNERARKLYTREGFFLTGYNMSKNLTK